MSATSLLPLAVSGYYANGTRKLMAVSHREMFRAETFLRRVLRAERPVRGRHALIISTLLDLPQIMPLENVLISMGAICCCAEANPYDGARIESIIRRFDVAVVAVITDIVLQAIRSTGHDPLTLLAGKIVWAAGAAYETLQAVPDIDLRRWAMLGPVLAIEGRHGGGAHVDGREWEIESEGGATYVSSRLDRAHDFHRLRIDMPVKIVTGPCRSGAQGPRIVL